MTKTTTKPSLEQEIAERFKRDTAKHTLAVLHDDGLYRHLQFRQPDNGFYWFELVTWPGSLAFRGGVGARLVFSRSDDMFGFFRANGNTFGINPGYWAEKLPDYGESVRKYSDNVLKAELESRLTDYEKDEYPDLAAEYEVAKAAFDALPALQRWPFTRAEEPVAPKSPDDIRKLIAEYDDNGDLGHEDGARQLLRELERAGLVSDTWEWNLTDYAWEYLWACHAIVWGIRQYDAAKKADADGKAAELAGASR